MFRTTSTCLDKRQTAKIGIYPGYGNPAVPSPIVSVRRNRDRADGRSPGGGRVLAANNGDGPRRGMIVALVRIDRPGGLSRRNCQSLPILCRGHDRSEAALELDDATSRLSGRTSGQRRRTAWHNQTHDDSCRQSFHVFTPTKLPRACRRRSTQAPARLMSRSSMGELKDDIYQ